jgi:hypothetical protein
VTNDERMTKIEARNAPEDDEAFWTAAESPIVREEPEMQNVCSIWRNAQRDSERR